MPTQILSYLIALVVLLISTAANAGFAQPWTVWALVPLNAVLVSTASNGAYQAIARVSSKSGT
jgi:fatty acid desaturase